MFTVLGEKYKVNFHSDSKKIDPLLKFLLKWLNRQVIKKNIAVILSLNT